MCNRPQSLSLGGIVYAILWSVLEWINWRIVALASTILATAAGLITSDPNLLAFGIGAAGSYVLYRMSERSDDADLNVVLVGLNLAFMCGIGVLFLRGNTDPGMTMLIGTVLGVGTARFT